MFRLDRERQRMPTRSPVLGLNYEHHMMCEVEDVLFAPTVHGLYQIPRFCGLEFQPMVDGASEMLQLQRAAVYHEFPGYNELISQHGFLGIQVKNPYLVRA